MGEKKKIYIETKLTLNPVHLLFYRLQAVCSLNTHKRPLLFFVRFLVVVVVVVGVIPGRKVPMGKK